jgi:hypothetical protein
LLRLVLASALLFGQATLVAPPDVCVCAADRLKGGWCRVHQMGYVGGIAVHSGWLFDTIDPHGHDVDVTMFPCPTCQRAVATDGMCREHKVGFVGGRAYFSVLTHHLAKGTVRAPAEISCARCRANARGHGWCDRCKVGMLGATTLHDRAEYEEAIRAAEVLQAADRVAARCDRCAAAMVTDTICPVHLITYKDGKAVARS